jgi:hypothetical protein
MKNFLLVTSGNEYKIYSLMFNIKMNEHVTSTSSKITVVRVLKITGSRSD